MIEIALFIGTFCVFFFLPTQFRIYYKKVAWDDTLVFEMRFLGGMLKRKREISVLKQTPAGLYKQETDSGNWFFIKRSKVKAGLPASQEGNSGGWQGYFERYQHFGLGMTLLTFFLPAKYHHWLLVVDDLEQRGSFHKFTWVTRIGIGEAAGSAVLSGLVWGVKASLISILFNKSHFKKSPEIKVIPDYQHFTLDMLFDCIFHVKLGYIIIAAFIARLRHLMVKGGVGN